MCLVGNIRLKSLSMEGKYDVMKNESSELELQSLNYFIFFDYNNSLNAILCSLTV